MEAKLLPLSLHLCISILSHPLYLSYLIFFFPYIFTLFSFLFPLFIATSLLLLALYTLSPPLPQDYYDFSHFSESKVGVFSAFLPFLEDFEARKGESGEVADGCGEGKVEERAEFFFARSFPPLTQNFQENKEPESTHISEFKKNEEEGEKKMQVTEENPAEAEENPNSGPSFSRTKSTEDSQALGLNINGSPGSMRKEREWRRTLACKLYEERSSGEEGSERMDLLWETYEQESSRVDRNRRSSSRKCKNGGFKHEKKEKENEENEEDDNGDLCCLQAFKISAGKMNLGMGKGNLIKFSKALKGIGWFDQVKTKHLRKRL